MAAGRKVYLAVKRRRGITLIEAVLYIAVSLAVIVGGLVFFQQASVLSRINQSVYILGSIVAEARAVSVEGSVPAANGLNFENVLRIRGAIPQSYWDATKPSGQRLQLPFEGSYAFMNVSFGGGVADEILLNMVNIPLSMCVRVGASANGTGLLGAGINQTSLKDSPTALVTMFIGSLNAGGMATTCKIADTNGDGRVMLRINFRTWS
ncbi:MAG: hypothetical protein IOD05_10795 [Rhodobacter sp.]|nr:hypothetical protein [Rhodobacter sp.]MCA3494571.1 hypothetical protein [Rhodobacter sp.]MCA3500282.1 hypothetical protein [Rhodobacter sp.]MCA3503714.1 hypothetical protein [Rhodobacter sp.]MCA3516671.1 hypothetical protein [Rhodobacter sp.]